MKKSLSLRVHLYHPHHADTLMQDIRDRYAVLDTGRAPLLHMICMNGTTHSDQFRKELVSVPVGEIRSCDAVIIFQRWEAWQHDGDYAISVFRERWPDHPSHLLFFVSEGLRGFNDSQYQYGSYTSLDGWVTHMLRDAPHTFSDKTHSFVCFNRVNRTHRCATVAMLERNSLIEHGLVSYTPTGNYYGSEEPHAQSLIQSSNFISPELKDSLRAYGHTAYKVDDINVSTYRYHDSGQDGRKEAFSKSMFSLITETFYSETPMFITEKTYGAIAERHPFIIVGQPGVLAMLRQFGFKTFGEVFDESYDNISDHSLRLERIISEVTKFSLSTDKVKEKKWEILNDIAEYNYAHLVNSYHGRSDRTIPHFTNSVVTLFNIMDKFSEDK